jgi:flagellar motor switch protein FliM
VNSSPSAVRTAARVLPAGGQERRRAPGAVTPYDFRRPLKLSRENSRPLQIAFETFARQASTLMTSALRSVCHIDLVEFEQLTYTEYVDSLDELTYMGVFTAEPMQQPGVLELPLAVAMACVDRLLGGPGAAEQPERPLTELESAVVAGLYERLVAEVRYAFSSIVALEPVVKDVEYSPQLAQLANASDPVLVARFKLRRGDAEHPITLCLSFNGLLPYLTASGGAVVSERERAERAQSSARLAAGLQEVPVDVSVRFRATGADPIELSGLQVGDVVRLRHPAAAPLDVTAADVVFAHATPGSQGQRLAALVVAPPTQENP